MFSVMPLMVYSSVLLSHLETLNFMLLLHCISALCWYAKWTDNYWEEYHVLDTIAACLIYNNWYIALSWTVAPRICFFQAILTPGPEK